MGLPDPYALLEQIAQVAHLARPDDPGAVTQRAFDRAAARDERFTELPRAQHLVRHLRQSWRDLVALSLRPAQERERTLAMRRQVERAGSLSHDQGIAAVRIVACKLGWVASLSPSEYRQARTDAIAASRDPESVAKALPNENQLRALFGEWNDVLLAAGLQPTDGRTQPSTSSPSVIEVIDRCFEAHGALPTSKELAVFAEANSIPLPRRESGRAYQDYVREWQQDRAARGLEAADRPPLKRDRPDYGQPVGAARPGERRKARQRTREDILGWLRRYLDDLVPGERPTQRGYRDWVARHDGAPAASTLSKAGRGGFRVMIQAARELPAGRAEDERTTSMQ